MYENLLMLALFAYLYSLVAGRLEESPVNGALVFTAFGVIFGPLGLGLLHLDVNNETLRAIAEIALALVLFSDAANANLGVLRRNIALPRRLLLVGLPMTIALGWLLGVLMLDSLGIFEVALLAVMLAPTDAALGKAVVTDPAVPRNIRESLNVESGLNDGICVPILFLFLALALGEATNTPALILKLVAEEIGIGLVSGLILAYLGSYLFTSPALKGWSQESWERIQAVMLAIACFALAQTLGGSGFIAAFVGGLMFGARVRRHKRAFLLPAESTGDLMALVTWVIFGAGVVVDVVDDITWQVLLYAALSLTVIRTLPVVLCLAGTGLAMRDKLFMGWFGPRGLASIVFIVIVYVQNLPGGKILAATVVMTVVFSVVAHGISANPLVARLFETQKNP